MSDCYISHALKCSPWLRQFKSMQSFIHLPWNACISGLHWHTTPTCPGVRSEDTSVNGVWKRTLSSFCKNVPTLTVLNSFLSSLWMPRRTHLGTSCKYTHRLVICGHWSHCSEKSKWTIVWICCWIIPGITSKVECPSSKKNAGLSAAKIKWRLNFVRIWIDLSCYSGIL